MHSTQSILDSELKTHPFPYFSTDLVFPQALFDKILPHWPSHQEFKSEFPGSYVYDLFTHVWKMPRRQREVWLDVLEVVSNEIVPVTFQKYARWAQARYGSSLKEITYGMLCLLEADENYAYHLVHTHNYHDPTWLFTNLIYIDDRGNRDQGTSLYQAVAPNTHPCLDELAALSASTLQWEPPHTSKITKHTRLDFVPNRMLSFYETPISFHGVEPYAVKAKGVRRKILRIHAQVPTELTQELYGLPYLEYRNLRKTPRADKRTLDWLRRDLEQYLDAPPISECEALELRKTLRFQSPYEELKRKSGIVYRVGRRAKDQLRKAKEIAGI